MLDAAEEALDEVAALVLVPIEGALDKTVAARRDDDFDLSFGTVGQEGIDIVSLIGTERAGAQAFEQGQRLRAVAGLPAG